MDTSFFAAIACLARPSEVVPVGSVLSSLIEFGSFVSNATPRSEEILGSLKSDLFTPTICSIRSALGGGFEVALGCRSRVAVASASIGLPEVNLGLVPGAGGTVRTPRLAPLATAVELVTGGKPLRADKALQAGLIDAVIDGDLLQGSRDFALRVIDQPAPVPLRNRSVAPVDAGFWDETEAALRKRVRGEIAPLRALACLRKASDSSFDEALAFERETFMALRASPQALAMRLRPTSVSARFSVPAAELMTEARDFVRKSPAVAIGAADVVGFSYGGAVAQQLAIDHPERIRRLVLAATTCGWGAVPGPLQAMAVFAHSLRLYSPAYFERVAATLYGGVTSRDAGSRAHEGARHAANLQASYGYAMQLLGATGWTSLPYLERIRHETLVINGDDDPLVPVANAELLARRIPRATLEIVEEAGHLFL